MVDVTVITGVLTGLAWLVGGVLVLLAVVLCIPFRVAARVDGLDVTELPPEDAGEPGDGDTAEADTDAPSWNVRADWLWGVVQFRSRGGPGQGDVKELRVLGFRRGLSASGGRNAGPRGAHRGHRKPTAGTHKAKRRGSRPNPVLVARLARALLSEARWFVPRLWRALGVRVKGDLTYGFPDPFLTGMSQAVLANVPGSPDFRLTPDYGEGRLTGWIQVEAAVFPVRSALVLVRTAFRPAIRRIWWPQLRSAMRLSKAG